MCLWAGQEALEDTASVALPSSVRDAGDDDDDSSGGANTDTEPQLPLLSPAGSHVSPNRHIKAQARGEVHE